MRSHGIKCIHAPNPESIFVVRPIIKAGANWTPGHARHSGPDPESILCCWTNLQCWCQLDAGTCVSSFWGTLQGHPWLARSRTSMSAHVPRRKIHISRLRNVESHTVETSIRKKQSNPRSLKNPDIRLPNALNAMSLHTDFGGRGG